MNAAQNQPNDWAVLMASLFIVLVGFCGFVLGRVSAPLSAATDAPAIASTSTFAPATASTAPPPVVLDTDASVAPSCFTTSKAGVIYIDGDIDNIAEGSSIISNAGVLLSYGSQVKFITTDAIGHFMTSFPLTKAVSVRVLEVLIPSKDGGMLPVSGRLPSGSCTFNDGNDQ